MAMRSVIKKNKRRSQREAARLQKQAEALAEANLAMEEDEEIHFNRPETFPDTPRVSHNNTPDPEDEDRGETDYTVVLEMVKTVRDKLAAIVLDNTNIRAACDDLRQQCHSQGVAFGDLSRLVATGETITGRPRGDQSLHTGGDQTAPSYTTRVDRRWG